MRSVAAVAGPAPALPSTVATNATRTARRSDGRKRRSERPRTPTWWRRARISRRRSLRAHRADRSAATNQLAALIAGRMASNCAHVNDFLSGRDFGEGTVVSVRAAAILGTVTKRPRT